MLHPDIIDAMIAAGASAEVIAAAIRADYERPFPPEPPPPFERIRRDFLMDMLTEARR